MFMVLVRVIAIVLLFKETRLIVIVYVENLIYLFTCLYFNSSI